MNHFIVLTHKLSERPFTHKPPDEDILIGKPHKARQEVLSKPQGKYFIWRRSDILLGRGQKERSGTENHLRNKHTAPV